MSTSLIVLSTACIAFAAHMGLDGMADISMTGEWNSKLTGGMLTMFIGSCLGFAAALTAESSESRY